MKHKVFLAALVAFILSGSGAAVGGAIKTWVNETLTLADLNSNFSHMHNTMVGGHGARLVNADVSTSAAIAHTKMATPSLFPKMWTSSDVVCGASPCTQTDGNDATVVTRTGVGLYTVTFAVARPNNDYGVFFGNAAAGTVSCRWATKATTNVTIVCVNDAGAASDASIDIMLMDSDN